MSEKKSYIVKEPVRFGGKRRNVGDSVDLTPAEAIALAAFLEGETPPLMVVDVDPAGKITVVEVEELKQRIDALNGQLAERASDLDELTAENEGNKAALKTARETILALEGERDRAISDRGAAIDEKKKLEEDLAAARAQIADLEQQLAALKTAAPAPKKGGKS